MVYVYDYSENNTFWDWWQIKIWLSNTYFKIILFWVIALYVLNIPHVRSKYAATLYNKMIYQ